jgi:hypothetical protein
LLWWRQSAGTKSAGARWARGGLMGLAHDSSLWTPVIRHGTISSIKRPSGATSAGASMGWRTTSLSRSRRTPGRAPAGSASGRASDVAPQRIGAPGAAC